jgi:hypothetical protein
VVNRPRFRKGKTGSISEAFRKHFGSASEARNSLFLEENAVFGLRALPVEKKFAALLPEHSIPLSGVTWFPDRNLTTFCHFPDT